MPYGCLVEHSHNPPQAERKHFIFLETNSDLLPYSWLGGWGQKYSEERRITLNQKSAEGEKSQSLEWKEGIELETETLGTRKNPISLNYITRERLTCILSLILVHCWRALF